MRFTTKFLLFATIALITTTSFSARAAEPAQAVGISTMGLADLPARSCEGGRFMFVDKVPVLCVEGTPEEIGRQTAELLGEKAHSLMDYPRKLLHGNGREIGWDKIVACSRELWKNAPPEHRKEMDAFIAAADINRDNIIVGNLMMDIYRGMGCSSLIVESSRSQTGGPLFGRNLDFYGAGVLHKFSLVTVCRPQGKHAFAAVGFAGLLGCLTGINDAGLTIAVHEVMVARDNSALFDPAGVPYTFAFRRILEECATADEAEKLLRSMKRTTKLNLAVCDERKSFVLEMTPKSVVRRDAEDGLCICTNHFCTPQLMIFPFCRRFAALETAREMKTLSLADVEEKLHAANSGPITLQSMIFEPNELRLHLSAGEIPSSAGPYRTVDLRPLLSTEAAAANR